MNSFIIEHANFGGHQSREKIFEAHVVAKTTKQRHTQVRVRIDQTWHHDRAACINRLGCIIGDRRRRNCPNRAVTADNQRAVFDNRGRFVDGHDLCVDNRDAICGKVRHCD